MSKQPPPALARWLLRMQPLGARRAEIEADLEELYEVRLQDRGHRHAKWRYYRDVLSLWRAPGEPQTDPANRRGRIAEKAWTSDGISPTPAGCGAAPPVS